MRETNFPPAVGCSVKGKKVFFLYFSFHTFGFSSINVNCFRRKIKSFCVVKVHRGFWGMRLWRLWTLENSSCAHITLVSLDGTRLLY